MGPVSTSASVAFFCCCFLFTVVELVCIWTAVHNHFFGFKGENLLSERQLVEICTLHN